MLRTDETGFGDIKVIQKEGFGYGVDAVLLAAFASGETGARCAHPISSGGPRRQIVKAADLGTDCGIIAFIFAHKMPGAEVLGIEKREEAADRARQAVMLNGLDENIEIQTTDVADIASGIVSVGNDFDAVLSNPPYFRKGSAIPSMSDDRYIARHETTAGIGEFALAAASMLKSGGSFYLVHRPDRLPDIFESLRKAGMEPKEMQMVTPHPGEPANIVLIHAVKGAGPGMKLLPEIAVHTLSGEYTDTILRIYERS